jgi:hypothetical protein
MPSERGIGGAISIFSCWAISGQVFSIVSAEQILRDKKDSLAVEKLIWYEGK